MIILFPLRCQTAFVRRVVDELRCLPSQKQRDQKMVRFIGEKYELMVSIIEDDIAVERDLVSFADEVWSRLNGEKAGGVA